ncbi:MAG: hypothetical protein UH854_01350, partial [Clostridia bacterium]|nr:hypothetical protein [Clostridia bacterium]
CSNIQQAIFILKDTMKAIEDYDVLDEANHIIYQYVNQSNGYLSRPVKKRRSFFGKGKHQS